MQRENVSRRQLILSAVATGVAAATPRELTAATLDTKPVETPAATASRAMRMGWWHEAKFGMFIHWGLYSVIGREEWIMEMEGIPVRQYELLADQFLPVPNVAREWARLARKAGQKYMVMTTKHHEGFCLFDSKLTDYCAPKSACKRDLVREFVDAARAEGLRVGFYYSLMDWHHPDGARCATDEEARKRFVAYTHGVIRELMTNYGKIDILWYDVDWPLNAVQWESKAMNEMVFSLQPDIIVNNRNGLDGDFQTPEQKIESMADNIAWESCMTLNGSWGYSKGDQDWKSPATVIRNLLDCAKGGGNYLLNIGPKPDGSIPLQSVSVLESVGQWMRQNGGVIYGADKLTNAPWHPYATYTVKGNTLFMCVFAWPGHTAAENSLSFYKPPVVFAIGGLHTKVESIRLMKTKQPLQFTQDDITLRISGLAVASPDEPITVIELKCYGKPVIDHEYVRTARPR
ncbi:MAG TPA: alpha-L-fucosidase [Acidobacteriaceae bacterium]